MYMVAWLDPTFWMIFTILVIFLVILLVLVSMVVKAQVSNPSVNEVMKSLISFHQILPVQTYSFQPFKPILTQIFVHKLIRLHSSDISNLKSDCNWVQHKTSSRQPVARAAHSSTTHDQYFYIFGGFTGQQALDDLWRFDSGMVIEFLSVF